MELIPNRPLALHFKPHSNEDCITLRVHTGRDFPSERGEELLAAIHEFTPTVIVFEKMEVVPYLELTRTVFDGPVVLDLDEVSGPLNRSLVSQTTDV